MSPWWSDRLLVAFCPDGLGLIRCRPGRPEVLNYTEISCSSGTPPSWRTALSALADALKDPAWARTAATVILSNHLVRYTVIPWADAVQGMKERRALARLHFQKVHGPRAETWDVRVSPGRIGAPWLASALDADLLPELTALFTAAGLTLRSVQPYLMSALNCRRAQLPKNDAWFVVREPQRLLLGIWRRGDWDTVRGWPLPTSFPDWTALLAREMITAGNPSGKTVYVFAPAFEALQLNDPVWQLQCLPFTLPNSVLSTSVPLAMAWTGH